MTDCLNYGNPEDPEALWEFRQGVRGIADAARKPDAGAAQRSGASGNGRRHAVPRR